MTEGLQRSNGKRVDEQRRPIRMLTGLRTRNLGEGEALGGRAPWHTRITDNKKAELPQR